MVHVGRPWRLPPLPWVAIGLVLGIALDDAVAVSWWWAAAGFAAAVALFAIFKHQTVGWLCVLLAATSLGAIRHGLDQRCLPADHIAHYTSEQAIYARLQGRVVTTPRVSRRNVPHLTEWVHRPARTQFILAVEQIATHSGLAPTRGLARVTVQEPMQHVRPGQRVSIFGTMYRPPGPTNPGQFDYARYLRRQHIWVGLSCQHAAGVRLLESGDGQGSVPWRGRLRAWARGMLVEGMASIDTQSLSVLEAMVLGQRNAVDRAVDNAFVRTGTVHFLSVSGVHVGFLALMVWWLSRWLGLGMRAGAGMVAGCVLIYAGLAEPRPPVLRATVLALLACWAVGRHRPLITGNWLALSAVLLLLFRPTDLFNVGFQLSFVVLIGVMYGSRALYWEYQQWVRWRRELMPPAQVHRLRQAVWGWVRSRLGFLLCVAVAAWLMGLPLTAYHFGRVTPYGWLNTLLITPLIFLVMAGAFVKLLWTALWPSLAVVPGWLLAKITGGLLWEVKWLAAVPWTSCNVPAPPLWMAGILYLLLLGWTFRSYRPGLLTRRRMLIASLVVMAVLTAAGLHRPRPRDSAEIWCLDVGHGLAVYMEFPDGGNALYDLGTLGDYDVAASALLPFLTERRVRGLDQVVISHPNLDHYSGLPSLLDHRAVGAVLVSEHFAALSPPGTSAGAFLEHLGERGRRVEQVSAESRLDAGPRASIDVLWPPPPSEIGELSRNDSSIVMRVGFGGQSMLLCGDLQGEGIAGLLARYPGQLQADVLLLPHHASPTPELPELIAAVRPAFVVSSNPRLSADRRAAVCARIGELAWLDTDRCGAIHICLGADGPTARGFVSGQVGALPAAAAAAP